MSAALERRSLSESGPGGSGACGAGRPAWAGARTARSPRSKAAITVSNECRERPGPISFSSIIGGFRGIPAPTPAGPRRSSRAPRCAGCAFAMPDPLEYTSPPFFGPTYEDRIRQAPDRPGGLVPRRRQRQDARAARLADRASTEGQAQGRLQSARRHGRPRGGGERAEGARYRAQAERQDLLSPHRPYRRNQIDLAREAARRAPGTCHRVCREGYAAKEPTRAAYVPQAARLRGGRAPPSGAAAKAARDSIGLHQCPLIRKTTVTTEPAAARLPLRASTSSPAVAASR